MNCTKLVGALNTKQRITKLFVRFTSGSSGSKFDAFFLPELYTPNPQPQTLNTTPQTPNPFAAHGSTDQVDGIPNESKRLDEQHSRGTFHSLHRDQALNIRPRKIEGSVGFVVSISSHESATFRGAGHLCGRVARLATSQGLLDVPAQFDGIPNAPEKLDAQQSRGTFLCLIREHAF